MIFLEFLLELMMILMFLTGASVLDDVLNGQHMPWGSYVKNLVGICWVWRHKEYFQLKWHYLRFRGCWSYFLNWINLRCYALQSMYTFLIPALYLRMRASFLGVLSPCETSILTALLLWSQDLLKRSTTSSIITQRIRVTDGFQKGTIYKRTQTSSAQLRQTSGGVWFWVFAYSDNLVKKFIWAYPENLDKIWLMV